MAMYNGRRVFQVVRIVGGGTIVYVNGQPVATFDADTKLDKDTSTTSYAKVYIKKADGSQDTTSISSTANQGFIAQWGTGGRMATKAPVNSADAVNLSYANDHYNGKRYLHNIIVTIDDGVLLFSFVVQVVNASATAITDGRYIFNSGNFVSVNGYDFSGSFAVAPILTRGYGYPHGDGGAAVLIYSTNFQTWTYFDGLSSSATGVSSCSLVDTVTAF